MTEIVQLAAEPGVVNPVRLVVGPDDPTAVAGGVDLPQGAGYITRSTGQWATKYGPNPTDWTKLAATTGFLPLSGGNLNPAANLGVPGVLVVGTDPGTTALLRVGGNVNFSGSMTSGSISTGSLAAGALTAAAGTFSGVLTTNGAQLFVNGAGSSTLYLTTNSAVSDVGSLIFQRAGTFKWRVGVNIVGTNTDEFNIYNDTLPYYPIRLRTDGYLQFTGGVLQIGSGLARFENTSASVHPSATGVGIEFGISGGIGIFQVYNRSTVAYANASYNAGTHTFVVNGTTRLTIDGTTGATVNGTLLAGADVSANGNFRIGATPGIVIQNSSSYNIFYSSAGAHAALYLGNTGDPANYYRNSTHYFDNTAGSVNFLIMNASYAYFKVPVQVAKDVNAMVVAPVTANGTAVAAFYNSAQNQRQGYVGMANTSNGTTGSHMYLWSDYGSAAVGGNAAGGGVILLGAACYPNTGGMQLGGSGNRFGSTWLGNTDISGTLVVSGAITEGGTPVAKYVISTVDPTTSDVYPVGTIWFNKTGV